MATAAQPRFAASRTDTGFFTVLAFAMAFVIIAGFSLNIAMGRSSFAAPLIFHVHATIFMSWVALYVAQGATAYRGNWALHRTLGKVGYILVPTMVVAASAIMIFVARSTGGPFFFNVSEFLIGNLVGVLTFGVLAWWALRRQRYMGWHRRLLLVAMSILTGPGIGRLLPLPLMIPNAWTISFCVTLIFPIAGMIADRRRYGEVHSAYWWGTGIVVATFVLSLLFAHSSPGYEFTEWVIQGTPGAERPIEAYLPPGFAM